MGSITIELPDRWAEIVRRYGLSREVRVAALKAVREKFQEIKDFHLKSPEGVIAFIIEHADDREYAEMMIREINDFCALMLDDDDWKEIHRRLDARKLYANSPETKGDTNG